MGTTAALKELETNEIFSEDLKLMGPVVGVLVAANGGHYVPVLASGGFSGAPGSIYRSMLSSCRQLLLEDH